MRCPKAARFDGDITGCGSVNIDGPDSEGWYDCLDCGIEFDGDAAEFIDEQGNVTPGPRTEQDPVRDA